MLCAAAAIVGAILYRLRGGWFADLTGLVQPTQVSRVIWAGPTAALIYALAGGPWWLVLALFVSTFASQALIGHGAHMVYSRVELRKAHWIGHGHDVELLTRFWLPLMFSERPNESWPTWRVFLFHGLGMSVIGLVRNALAALPLFWFAPLAASIYTATGLLHGPAYWTAWRLPRASSANGELIVGAISWAAIVILLR